MFVIIFKQKLKYFFNFEEYFIFCIVDIGVIFVEVIMFFGMGFILFKYDKVKFDEVIWLCFVSLVLVNDYFSFDREYVEFCCGEKRNKEESRLVNVVWLCMNWYGVVVEVVKGMVREVCNGYVKEFLRWLEEFLRGCEGDWSEKDVWERYFRGLKYQVSGNVVWSLRCLRYYFDERGFDFNVGVEDVVMVEMRRGFFVGKQEEEQKESDWW